MKKHVLFAGLWPAALLCACGKAPDTPAPVPASSHAALPAQPGLAAPTDPSGGAGGRKAPPGYGDGSGVNDGYPDLTPARLDPAAEKTEAGARNVLLSFARALELKEFDQAWELLSDNDQQVWPKASFTKLFADFTAITVAIGDGRVEGAAGSSYYTAPLTVTAIDRGGRPVRLGGDTRLRRVNDVDGATAAQLRWHLDHVSLDWQH